ncbi:MAG TPA: hypothetical protein VFB15_05175 [Candidatus Binataceae bacterium]|jgi:hypothetical protein|nr:hypothetical protein [Candidatus Binataceae bacterium]
MDAVTRALRSISPQARRLRRLAAIAGAAEAQAAILRRHAAITRLPGFRQALESLAAAESADAKALRELLLTHRLWPIPPAPAVTEGSNNWQRISLDLQAEIEMARALGRAIAEWEGRDRQLAAELRTIAAHKEEIAGHLRDLALRCDPQALD